MSNGAEPVLTSRGLIRCSFFLIRPAKIDRNVITIMEPEAAQAEEAVRQAQATANRLFPVPPFYYKAFTDSAWKTHKTNRLEDEQASGQGQAGPSNLAAVRKTVAEEEVSTSGPPWNPFTTSDREDLASKTGIIFEPPRTDWIIEDGTWEAFGQLHPVRRFYHSHFDYPSSAECLIASRLIAPGETDGRARAQSTAIPPDRYRMRVTFIHNSIISYTDDSSPLLQ